MGGSSSNLRTVAEINKSVHKFVMNCVRERSACRETDCSVMKFLSPGGANMRMFFNDLTPGPKLIKRLKDPNSNRAINTLFCPRKKIKFILLFFNL